MVMSVQEPFISKEINGKKNKNKKGNLEKVKERKVDEKVTELNGGLKEENELDVTHDKKKKKKQKKDKLEIESIDGDEKKSDVKSGLQEEKLKTSLSEEMPDTKEKKKKKNKKSEGSVGSKEENDVRTTEADNVDDGTDDKKKKQKKNKNKIVTQSIDDDEKNSDIESVLPVEKPKTSLSEETTDTKDKKKKKKKSEPNVDLKEENHQQMTEAETAVDVTNHKEKKQKKKKKDKIVTESIDGDEKSTDIELVLPEEKPKTAEHEETTNTKDKKKKKKTKKETREVESLEPADIGVDNDQISKKRKRSDENEVQPAEETTVKDSKRRKSEGLEVDSKQIVANGEIIKNDPLKLSNGPEKSGQKQQRNNSAEPKTVHAFQRVKIDEVEFVDDRLQDNSYWAKSGAEKGYGAKAQEILGQVRGRDFRHEKTKKKRGSYRGGLIDLDSHSIKFNYSDEE